MGTAQSKSSCYKRESHAACKHTITDSLLHVHVHLKLPWVLSYMISKWIHGGLCLTDIRDTGMSKLTTLVVWGMMDVSLKSKATKAALHMNEYVEWVSTLCACINVWNIMNNEHDTWLQTDGEGIFLLNMYRYLIYSFLFAEGRWNFSLPCVVTQMVLLLVMKCCVYLYTACFSTVCKFLCTLLYISVRPYVRFQPAPIVPVCYWCHGAS